MKSVTNSKHPKSQYVETDQIAGLKLTEQREGSNTVYGLIYTGRANEDGKTKIVVRTYSHNHDTIAKVPAGTKNYVLQKIAVVDDEFVAQEIERIVTAEFSCASYLAGTARQQAFEATAFAHIVNGVGFNGLPHMERSFPDRSVWQKRNEAEGLNPKVRVSVPVSNITIVSDESFLIDTDGE